MRAGKKLINAVANSKHTTFIKFGDVYQLNVSIDITDPDVIKYLVKHLSKN